MFSLSSLIFVFILPISVENFSCLFIFCAVSRFLFAVSRLLCSLLRFFSASISFEFNELSSVFYFLISLRNFFNSSSDIDNAVFSFNSFIAASCIVLIVLTF